MADSAAPVDAAVMEDIRSRMQTHPVIESVTAERAGDTISLLELEIDLDRYPEGIDEARLEIRWYTNGDYNMHYIETHSDRVWQCRWDRHQNPHTQRTHFHPLPAADSKTAVPDQPPDHHPSAIVTRTLANVRDRIEDLWE